MLGRTGVAHYGRRCSWAHSEGHIGVAHYGILVGGPLQLRWQPIGRRCLWAHLGEVPTSPKILEKEASEEHMNEPNKELAQQVAILMAQVKKLTNIDTRRDDATIEEVAI